MNNYLPISYNTLAQYNCEIIIRIAAAGASVFSKTMCPSWNDYKCVAM